MILDAGKNVAFFQKEAVTSNNGQIRNDYLHPVYLPDGTVITENAPQDHPHHRGIFWAWHQILIDNQPIGDQWELKDFTIDVRIVEFRRLASGNGILQTTSFYHSPAYENGQKAFIKENTTYAFSQQVANYRTIKIDIELTALADNMKIGGSDDEKGYGGFSVRMKLPEDVAFASSNGLVEPQNIAVEAGRYMNIYGSVAKNGNRGGVLIYSEPANQPGPQTWILRKSGSMQNAVFPGREPIDLKRDTPLKLSYTVVLYTGKIKENKILKRITSASISIDER